MVGEIKTIEERRKKLLALGKKQGYVTYEQLARELKGLEIDSDTLDDLYNFLTENEIDIVSEDGTDDASGEEITDNVNVEDLTLSKDVKIWSTSSFDVNVDKHLSRLLPNSPGLLESKLNKPFKSLLSKATFTFPLNF